MNTKIYILHENRAWTAPLIKELEALNLPHEEWFLDNGSLDLSSIPPEGVFYNRMSASSHTRNHRYAVEYTEAIIAWLESHNRRVINNRKALELEIRKSEQYLYLQQHGLKTPQTYFVIGEDQLIEASQKFDQPFVVKPNRGGKGLGVQLFQNTAELRSSLQNTPIVTLDGTYLIQDYIKPVQESIVRMEFIGGEFYYAVRVDASGGFELCPADACEVGDNFCPTSAPKNKFEILRDYWNPDIPKVEDFLKSVGIEIGAVEYAENEMGTRFIYDVNINTNYNSGAEQRNSSVNGMARIASFLQSEWYRLNYKEELSTILKK